MQDLKTDVRVYCLARSDFLLNAEDKYSLDSPSRISWPIVFLIRFGSTKYLDTVPVIDNILVYCVKSGR